MTNRSLTKKIIELQQLGYEQDFFKSDYDELICLQLDQRFPLDAVEIKLIDQQYDFMSHSFKYLHTVDTDSGQKGIALSNDILTLKKKTRLVHWQLPVNQALCAGS